MRSCGLSPSVVRAALMCSGAQLAFACSVVGGGYNIVLGAATLMLAIRPFYLYDVSFQLSFAAVLSILFFYPRMYRRRFVPQQAVGCFVELASARSCGPNRNTADRSV